ncbi:MAG: orotate phosphoribosyltransferase, partial [Clostridia bacterium]|nr:orotate phosphoribosyltransferase [Clostridia bacterium]
VRAVLDAVAPYGPSVVGIAALVDRSGGRVHFGVPLHVLLRLEVGQWKPEDCPLCRAGVPLERPKE